MTAGPEPSIPPAGWMLSCASFLPQLLQKELLFCDCIVYHVNTWRVMSLSVALLTGSVIGPNFLAVTNNSTYRLL